MFRKYLRRSVNLDLVDFMLSLKLFIAYTKCSFQVSLASELMCNYLSRDVTASFGYDYILRQVVFSFMNSVTETNMT